VSGIDHLSVRLRSNPHRIHRIRSSTSQNTILPAFMRSASLLLKTRAPVTLSFARALHRLYFPWCYMYSSIFKRALNHAGWLLNQIEFSGTDAVTRMRAQLARRVRRFRARSHCSREERASRVKCFLAHRCRSFKGSSYESISDFS
jgi:hypothetical protein